jgi:peptidoglycan/xylan/chitin deacetylase (PgdA/CDA1 family)
LDEILDHRRRHQLPPARAVAITFDDGYQDNHRLAFPRLRRRGIRATFFLVSAWDRNGWDGDGELADRPLMSWPEVRDMASAGMQIGAHTRRHRALPDLPAVEQYEEIAGSREDLERELGIPVLIFAYPYGRLDGTTVRLAEQAGFVASCCSRSGPIEPTVPEHTLPRLEVRGTDTLLQFALSVWRRGRPSRKVAR